MAFGRRRSGKEPASAEGGGRFATYLDAGCELLGELRFADDVRIEGRVQGEIRAQKLVFVGEPATVDASIEAESVVAYGTVQGDIRARRTVTLHKDAHVEGEIQGAGIVVEEGARFKGCIIIGSDEVRERVVLASDPPEALPETPVPAFDD